MATRSRARGATEDFEPPTAGWQERVEAGRALRASVPRASHADGGVPEGRDPIGILAAQGAVRVPELIGIRHSRMAQTPFAFLRGAAAVMAADLVSTPVTGPQVQLCGDAHIRNFGTFATPERSLSFSINDFDETLPGPWEWDVKRFAASLYVVAAEHGFSPAVCRELVVAAVRAYRERMAGYAVMTNLQVWYDRRGIDDLLNHYTKGARNQISRDIAKASRREHGRAIAKFAAPVEQAGGGDRWRFREEPPLQTHIENAGYEIDEVLKTFAVYRESLPDDKQVLLNRYRMVDVARRVVGVGSVGTMVWICLLQAPSRDGEDRIILQVKQAQPSALEDYLQPSPIAQAGRRVVAGQRVTQGPTDSFLGWCEAPRSKRQYYVRQLWDRKGRSDLTTLGRKGLQEHATLCSWALARAHARSGDSAMIAGYLGGSPVFDRAVAVFAERYAACTLADHRTLVAAVTDGTLPSSDVF